MTALKLYWLGIPVIEVGGMTRKLETRKATALLAYISLAETGILRERLAAMFWPEGDQQKAFANLRRNLSSLKDRLPEGALSIDRDIVSLNRKMDMWLDVEAFEKCLAKFEGHQHKVEGKCEVCTQVLEKAAGYYRGGFMEGFNLEDAPEFDEWQRFQRQAYDDKYCKVLERLGEAQAKQGQWEQAISLARRRVAVDVFNEQAQRQLMEYFGAAGQRNNVVKQFQELRRVLQEQLGQEPEGETISLYERLCDQAGTEKAKVGQKENQFAGFPLLKTKLYIPSVSSKWMTRLELVERLNEGVKKPLTVISAPAGFGKSTLLAEWISQTDLGVAWVSLDAGDNDPYRFLTYLIAALESVIDQVG